MQSDFLVVGSGVAGLLFALKASAKGKVVLLTKGELTDSNTRYAQGGVAAVWSDTDSMESHVNDTLVAGAGLCRRDAVERVVSEGPTRIQELINLGVEFSRESSGSMEYDLGKEGGHSERRILHAKDQTGFEIVRALIENVTSNSNIEIKTNMVAVDLITGSWLARREEGLPPFPDTVHGVYALNTDTGEVEVFGSKIVAMCTGGAGKSYLYTSNPDVATGDGMAMAYRAGALLQNMEFVQFHPTCLFHPDARRFLISEALRGEGGVLRRSDGSAFMKHYDKRGDLAPRDIVARAIDSELKKTGGDCVYLDMTHHSEEYLKERFPSIYERCASLGIMMESQGIPVVPAAHYFCGGVATDEHGESTISGLFVVGESSCTGLHGANRLASNSLLEAAVYAHRAVEEASRRLPTLANRPLPEWDSGSSVNSDELVVIKHTWEEIRRFMWSYVGIVRTTRRLKRARHRVELVQEEIRNYYWDFRLTADLIELRNLAQVAWLVVESALARRESRGLHYTTDFPESDPRWLRDTEMRRRV